MVSKVAHRHLKEGRNNPGRLIVESFKVKTDNPRVRPIKQFKGPINNVKN